jgi:hypothetical protein
MPECHSPRSWLVSRFDAASDALNEELPQLVRYEDCGERFHRVDILPIGLDGWTPGPTG